MARPLVVTLVGRTRVRLDRYHPGDTQGWEKDQALERLQVLGEEFAELGNLLTYAGRHALLIVLQGRDASGKDGVIRKILDFSNIQNARVEAFKVPTEEERAHDFLWRVHRATPARGHLTMFNRSHYEDVIAARVQGIVPPATWRARYQHINAFEQLLADNDTLVLKFYLHISRDEQCRRLLEREADPRTAWKLNPGDWRELPMWDRVTEAYEEALYRCASPELPWYLVPADKKWFRNLAIMQQIVLSLRPHRERWLRLLAARRRKALPEIRALRKEARRKGFLVVGGK